MGKKADQSQQLQFNEECVHLHVLGGQRATNSVVIVHGGAEVELYEF